MRKSRRKKAKGFNNLGKATNSKRYCENCKKPRTFKYDNFIGHSRCVACGSNYSKRIEKNA